MLFISKEVHFVGHRDWNDYTHARIEFFFSISFYSAFIFICTQAKYLNAFSPHQMVVIKHGIFSFGVKRLNPHKIVFLSCGGIWIILGKTCLHIVTESFNPFWLTQYEARLKNRGVYVNYQYGSTNRTEYWNCPHGRYSAALWQRDTSWCCSILYVWKSLMDPWYTL